MHLPFWYAAETNFQNCLFGIVICNKLWKSFRNLTILFVCCCLWHHAFMCILISFLGEIDGKIACNDLCWIVVCDQSKQMNVTLPFKCRCTLYNLFAVLWQGHVCLSLMLYTISALGVNFIELCAFHHFLAPLSRWSRRSVMSLSRSKTSAKSWPVLNRTTPGHTRATTATTHLMTTRDTKNQREILTSGPLPPQ